jgi:hypothetical protein
VQAIETLDDIVDQCKAVLSEIEFINSHHRENKTVGRDEENPGQRQSSQLGSAVVARLHYLLAHLDSLRSTLSVLLQTLNTAQSIIWAR